MGLQTIWLTPSSSHVGHDLVLDDPPQHGVLRLARDELDAELPCECDPLADLLGGPLADADVERLALAHDVGERLHRLLERRLGVVAVRLVEVDVVGLEPLQRAVDRLHDVLARQAGVVLAAGAGRPVDLREDLEALAPLALERLAEDRLGLGVGVDVGGVEGADAGFERGPDALGGHVVLHLRAVGEPVAVGDLGDLESAVAEVSEVHADHRMPGSHSVEHAGFGRFASATNGYLAAMDAHTRTDQRVDRDDTADPEDGPKPDSIRDLRRDSWKYVLRRTVREFSKDQCTDLAAALVYYSMLAIFPAAIALLSVVGLVGQADQTVDHLTSVLKDAGAGSAAETVTPILQSLSTSSGAGLAFVAGLAVALWSASGYVSSFGRAMNRVYEIPEGRPFWKLRPLMLLLTLIAVVLAAAVALALVISGPVAQAVGEAVGLGSAAVTAWNIAKWPVMLLAVALIVALLYYATPNVKQPKFRWISVGAIVAILTWIVASAAFGFYVANFSNYNKTYGSLAGVVVFLLWLWITNLALLFGAELDAELERARELQGGMPAEESIQLPPRDTTKIDKEEKKRADEQARGRQLADG